jgi:FtsZ-interacting cell division protein ZipA
MTLVVLVILAVAIVLLLIIGTLRWRAFSEFERIEWARFASRRQIDDIERQAIRQMTDVLATQRAAAPTRSTGTDIIEGTATEVDRS